MSDEKETFINIDKVESMINGIEKFKRLSYKEKEKIYLKVPKWGRAKIFAKYCNKNELNKLFTEWINTGDESMLTKTLKALKKNHSPYYSTLKHKYG